MKHFFRIAYLREGKERTVTAVFADPAKAEPWARRIYGTNLLAVTPTKSKNLQQVLELVLEAPPTEETA